MRVPALVESSAIRSFDLPLLHPDRVSVVPNGGSKVLSLIDEVGTVDTARHHDRHASGAVAAQFDNVESKHRRGNCGNRRAT